MLVRAAFLFALVAGSAAAVVLGDRAARGLAEIWAPTDGFIADGGVELSL